MYFPDDQLKAMSAEEKKAAKKVLTDDYELDEGVDFGKNMTKAEAEKLMKRLGLCQKSLFVVPNHTDYER